MGSGGTASRYFQGGFVVTKKRRLLRPRSAAQPSVGRGAHPPLYPPPRPTRALEPREGFADVVWAQEISEQLPGEQHCPEQAGEGSRSTASRCVSVPVPVPSQPQGRHKAGYQPLSRIQTFPGLPAGGPSRRGVTVQGGLSLPAVPQGCACRARPQPCPGACTRRGGAGGELHTRAGESRRSLSGGGKVPPGAGLFFSPHMYVFPHSLCSAMAIYHRPYPTRHQHPLARLRGRGPGAALASPGKRPRSPGAAPRGSGSGSGYSVPGGTAGAAPPAGGALVTRTAATAPNPRGPGTSRTGTGTGTAAPERGTAP